MIVGSTIIHDGTGSTPYYSASFPRAGLAATFALDVTHRAGAPTLVATIEHRNYDDTSWTTAGTLGSISTVGVHTTDVSDIKEEVRVAFTFAAGSVGDFVHVQLPAPAWRPY